MNYDPKALERLFAQTSLGADRPVSEAAAEAKITEAIQAETPKPRPAPRQITDVLITELSDYPKQMFKPYTEEKLRTLEASIRENGVIEPLIVRSIEGSYQIICGHKRKRAAAQAGFETLPCIVENLSDDEADIKMVETNLQTRKGLLPSEKGFAYKLKLEALKHQGQRTDLTLGPGGEKLKIPHTDELLANAVNESARQIQRYIRLTFLVSPLLDLVDGNTLQLKPAVELSYMSPVNQETVYNYFYVLHKLYIDDQLAKQLKEHSRTEDLTDESITALLPHSEGKTVKQTSKFFIPTKPLIKLLDTNALTKDVEKEILEVLIEYFQKKQTDKPR
ncbi:MAG: ParB/RepB/Spo0J family partition protein [Oscillospiraceae bacterium]|nr:ParB/RepB/Spo0J family partition protein [Oscillospiraceae bacterium]